MTLLSTIRLHALYHALYGLETSVGPEQAEELLATGEFM